MKNIRPRLVGLLSQGYCTPQISQIAKQLKEPSTTIHYNIKRMEQEGTVRVYKAVFDYKQIEQGFCCYVLVNLSPGEYGNPERIGKELAKYQEIESIDICTGDWELVLKVHVKDQDAYFEFLKNVISRKGVERTKSLVSFKQLKSEFVPI